MLYMAISLVIALAVVSSEAASVHICTNSFACGQDMCCRSLDGSVISDHEMGGFGGPFLPMGGAPQNGTCSTRKAQKGEVCDSSCQCDTGFACYRPMSGVCCPPKRCYDEEYVKKQQAYWSKCLSDPSCPIPP